MERTNFVSEPDIVLVNQIKSGGPASEDALIALTQRHSGLITTMIKACCPSGHRNDLFNDKFLLVYNSANKYDPEKANGCKFSSFLGNEVRWVALGVANSKEMCEIPSDSPVIEVAFRENECFDFVEVDESGFINDLVRAEIESLEDERAKKIFMLRYFSKESKNLSWEKVSEQVELSIQGCIDVHNRNVEIIKKNIKKKYGRESLV